MSAQTILSSLPADAFPVIAGLGNVSSGGAVAFTPQQDCTLSSVTLWLRGYTGVNGQEIKAQLFGNSPLNQPEGQLGSFNVPPPNDGSIAGFTFNLPANIGLKGGKTYWIFIYAGQNDASMQKGTALYWLQGNQPSGTAAFSGSLAYAHNVFAPSSSIPAFSIATV
jgi:hypothetical protein